MDQSLQGIPNFFLFKISGADAVKFLNNFCTADLKRWDRADPIELMILDPKGRLLALASAFWHGEALYLLSLGKPLEDLVSHLERYIIMDDAAVSELPAARCFFCPTLDRQSWIEQGLQIAGLLKSPLRSDAADTLAFATSLGGDLLVSLSGDVDPDQPSVAAYQAGFGSAARDFCGSPVGEASNFPVLDEFHWRRIALRFPVLGQDTNAATLPQELQRDHVAISFTKGCYLGQETVARLDALGHLNWVLTKIDLSDPLCRTSLEPVTASQPPQVISVWQHEKNVGQLLSIMQQIALVRIRQSCVKTARVSNEFQLVDVNGQAFEAVASLVL